MFKRRFQVFPTPNISISAQVTEVRKGRLLRIQHLNPSAESEVPSVKLNQTVCGNILSRCTPVRDPVGGSSSVWSAQMKYFADLGLEIVAPDLIGHGYSSAPNHAKAYHFKEIASDIEAIFDKYSKKRNLVIGHSYGCAFATILARKRVRRVWGLVLISGGAPTPLAPQAGIFSLPSCIVSCIRPCLNRVFERSAFKVKNERKKTKDIAFTIPTYVLRHLMNGQDWPEGDEIYHSFVTVPTLLISGRHDLFAKLEDELIMNETIYGSQLKVVEDASHMVMLESPETVNKLIKDFINVLR